MAPISKGDHAEVIAGLGRAKSPNLGLQVLVGTFQGEHSIHGRVHRCTDPELKQLADNGTYQTLGWADIPVAWLRKIDPTQHEPGMSVAKKETA